MISTILFSRSFICASASVILLWIPSGILFISVYLFFSSCRSLVNISFIFSIFASILFPRSCIILTVIILNFFSRKLPISTSFSCFFGILSVPSSGTYFPGGSNGKASAYSAGDSGSTPGSGRSPGEGNGNPLQYSCLENPMDGGAW